MAIEEIDTIANARELVLKMNQIIEEVNGLDSREDMVLMAIMTIKMMMELLDERIKAIESRVEGADEFSADNA